MKRIALFIICAGLMACAHKPPPPKVDSSALRAQINAAQAKTQEQKQSLEDAAEAIKRAQEALKEAEASL